jgi:hypothetical protein
MIIFLLFFILITLTLIGSILNEILEILREERERE